MLESHCFYELGKRHGLGPYMSIGVAGDKNIDALKTYGGGIILGEERTKREVHGIKVWIDTGIQKWHNFVMVYQIMQPLRKRIQKNS